MVTAAPERACAASDPKAVCAPPPLWAPTTNPSSLWKTLRCLAPQGHSATDANTGISAKPGGVRRTTKEENTNGRKGASPSPEPRTPQSGARAGPSVDGGIRSPCRARALVPPGGRVAPPPVIVWAAAKGECCLAAWRCVPGSGASEGVGGVGDAGLIRSQAELSA